MNDHQSSIIFMNKIFNIIFDVFKRWQVILLVTVSCALLFDTYKSMTYVPLYRCEATFAVKTSNNSNNKNDTDSDVGETFSYIFSSNVFKKTIEKAMNVDTLNGTFYAEVYEGTNVLHVYAYSPSALTSYQMMKALMANYQDISNLVVGNTNIDVVKDISVPTFPDNSLNHKRNIIMVGGISFIGCIAVLIFLSFMNNTIKDKYEVESKLNLHLIGSLPKESKIVSLKGLKRKKSILVSQFSTSFQYVEACKRIRSRIERYCKKHHAKVIMITSTLENEGKSSIAVNTALSLAMNKHKVLLMDVDLRKPSLHLILDENRKHKGIENYLCENALFDDVVVHLDNYQIDVIFGYNTIENVSDYIQSDKMEKLLNEAKNRYDYIIVDSAPSRFLSDSRMLSTLVDGIVLVVKQNFANVSTILNTIEKMSLSKTNIIGCINNQSISLNLHSGKYYGYKYGYNRYYSHRRKDVEHE